MNDFLFGLTGEIVTPFDPVYSEARQGFNRAVQLFPLIIVYCSDKRDVCNAVIWSGKHCVPIHIRSGGHNYEGYSNGDCTLVIDISRMNQMHIDPCLNQLTVQSGVTNKQVYEFAASEGYPFPGGTCPTVGVSGYTLGGG
ncbi:FAD-binding oxidoreductase [Konateibacter massiliensis]|uniref:FAD-binding oxidoreductase n=1 Tax=Konateibacter massiliensis TaxID=2002841 RepID=UPI001F3EE720|nr:FAD-dependent oxidoreductase [Konateibacter massiliensis]